MPGGLLAEKFGGKHTLGLGILSTAVFTLLTPLAVDIGGKYLLLAVRILEGLGEVSFIYVFATYRLLSCD